MRDLLAWRVPIVLVALAGLCGLIYVIVVLAPARTDFSGALVGLLFAAVTAAVTLRSVRLTLSVVGAAVFAMAGGVAGFITAGGPSEVASALALTLVSFGAGLGVLAAHDAMDVIGRGKGAEETGRHFTAETIVPAVAGVGAALVLAGVLAFFKESTLAVWLALVTGSAALLGAVFLVMPALLGFGTISETYRTAARARADAFGAILEELAERISVGQAMLGLALAIGVGAISLMIVGALARDDLMPGALFVIAACWSGFVLSLACRSWRAGLAGTLSVAILLATGEAILAGGIPGERLQGAEIGLFVGLFVTLAILAKLFAGFCAYMRRGARFREAQRRAYELAGPAALTALATTALVILPGAFAPHLAKSLCTGVLTTAVLSAPVVFIVFPGLMIAIDMTFPHPQKVSVPKSPGMA